MQVAVLRAMQQLSEVYSVMTIESLSELVPFFGFSEVEQIIVEAVKQGYLQVCHLLLPPLHTVSEETLLHRYADTSAQGWSCHVILAHGTSAMLDLEHLQR